MPIDTWQEGKGPPSAMEHDGTVMHDAQVHEMTCRRGQPVSFVSQLLPLPRGSITKESFNDFKMSSFLIF